METFKEQNERINQLSFNMEDIIEKCWQCHQLCLDTLKYCMNKGSNYADAQQLNFLLECSEVTKLTAEFIAHRSEFAHDMASLTANICEACSDSCQRMNENDIQLAKTIISCQSCADACRNLDH